RAARRAPEGTGHGGGAGDARTPVRVVGGPIRVPPRRARGRRNHSHFRCRTWRNIGRDPMTATIDGRIETMSSGEPPRLPRRGRPWRFALRLARREVRRRPGRTLLVMLLVAVPVLGMSVVMVFVRTNTDSA